LALLAPGMANAADGNRLTYLDEFCNPYYAGLTTAKLVTPQWVGQDGVEAVIVFSVDDLADPAVHERYLRPIIERLKKIDGRAPVSLMAKTAKPENPQLVQWLGEGLSLEAHTYDHPCPCLQGSDFLKAKGTYDRCVDIMVALPGSRAVGFRMPCCDSMNSPSPRFFTEIFNRVTPAGNFLHLDSSVFMVYTRDDPQIPRELVVADGNVPRFARYVPHDRKFVNIIENYPYPFVVSRLCWEIPSVIPDDWLGFNRNGNASLTTVADLKAALDATVVKQGEFTLTFHPYRWLNNDQVIELIDHALDRYGKKILFLNFREVHERLVKNVLGGQPLRAANGQDNGVRVFDVDGDGTMDAVIANEHVRQTRIWRPSMRTWVVTDFPVPLIRVDHQGNRLDAGVRFGVLQADGAASFLVRNEETAGLWHFDTRDMKWKADPQGLAGLDSGSPVRTAVAGRDRGVRLRDLDLDGSCELVVGNETERAVFAWSREKHTWSRLAITLPPGTTIVSAQGQDAGLRFVDVDENGFADVVFSNAERYSVDLFVSVGEGWARRTVHGNRGEVPAAKELPMIVRADGTNNGVWFNYRHMWVQNEDTFQGMPKGRPAKPEDTITVQGRHFVDDLQAGRATP
jgi:hypothetical protein